MSRYDVMVELAEKYADEHMKAKTACRMFGQTIVQKLAAYLGCPPANLIHCELDETLRECRPVAPITNALPTVTAGPDGFWHFGERLVFAREDQFPSMYMTCIFAIRKHGESFTLHYGKDFEITPTTEAGLLQFLAYFHDDMVEGLATPADEQRKRIGFYDVSESPS
jgi:hypothetical protein